MRFPVIFALLISAVFCQAQEKTSVKTFYIKGDESPTAFYGKRVDNIDSANYIRTVALNKNNENLYDVNEYYLNKNIKRIGNSLTNDFAPKFNGNVISYYKNGNKAAEELYVKGSLNGVSTYYYANKQLKKRTNIILEKGKYNETVLELNDSLGKAFLDENGTGNFKLIADNGDLVEGFYLNGKKDKDWKTINVTRNETYFDEYDADQYIKGKTIDAAGKVLTYDKLETMPTFKGGIQAFGKFLSQNLRYPPEARDNNIQGKVFLQFVIEKDGSLTEAKVIRSVGGGCDEEALRVINLSPKWSPGVQRGRAVRVSYTVPIFFQLQNNKSTTPPSTRKPFGTR